MFKSVFGFFLLISFLFLNYGTARSHCEIPCGIFDDTLRIELIKEHITTIEKSMKAISEIPMADSPDRNQLIRWIMNKEEHANKIQEIVSQYFLHQRIKITDPADKEAYKKYLSELEMLHKISVYAMKCKQTTDLSFISKLKETVKQFEASYFKQHKH